MLKDLFGKYFKALKSVIFWEENKAGSWFYDSSEVVSFLAAIPELDNKGLNQRDWLQDRTWTDGSKLSVTLHYGNFCPSSQNGSL